MFQEKVLNRFSFFRQTLIAHDAESEPILMTGTLRSEKDGNGSEEDGAEESEESFAKHN